MTFRGNVHQLTSDHYSFRKDFALKNRFIEEKCKAPGIAAFLICVICAIFNSICQ